MTVSAVVEAAPAPTLSISVSAPSGAEFKVKEIKNKDKTVLGTFPRLSWQSLDAAREFYGENAVLGAFNRGLGATLSVLTKRMSAEGKSTDEIATAQVKVKPGQRLPSAGKQAKEAFGSAIKAGAIKPTEALRFAEGWAKLSDEEKAQILELIPA